MNKYEWEGFIGTYEEVCEYISEYAMYIGEEGLMNIIENEIEVYDE